MVSIDSIKAGFAPVGPRRTFEGALEQIAERIRVGELGEGDRLPAERELAAAMQISRATLREAIRLLVDAGILTVRTGSAGGVFVASGFVPFELVRSRSELRIDEVSGVLVARRLMEPRVAQLASMNAREEDFAALRKITDAQIALSEDDDVLTNEDRFLQLGTQFHMRIARATGNATIVSLMRMLHKQLEIARDMAIHQPLMAARNVELHENTLAAIRSGDQERIEVVMDEHLASLEESWERGTGRVLVPTVPDFLLPVTERVLAENGLENRADF